MPIGSPPTDKGARFALNVVWNGIGVVAGLASGVLLSPYLIRKLGPDGYGVWALSFALVEYYWLLDLGFRSATAKFVAHYAALDEPEKIREVVSTAVMYAGCIALIIVFGIAIGAPFVQRLFQVSPAYQSSFLKLILIVSGSWSLSIVFGVFGASLEAANRFDLSNRAMIAGTVTRTLGSFVLLYLGFNLVALGLWTASTQLLTFGIQYFSFRKLFPHSHISYRYATRAMLKQMGGFGIHTFLVNISQQFLNQSAPLLIGYFRPAMFVGFYTLPTRLLQYTSEMVCRIGLVTNSSAAESAAHNDRSSLEQLAIYTNRYCLILFMPIAIVLSTHGDALFLKWVGPEFARHSAPVLPFLLLGNLLAIVGQFSSTMLLQGLAKHQVYARSLMVESILGVGTLVLVIPRYGIVGAACVSSAYMIVNRCLFTSWLTSRVISYNLLNFLKIVYGPPILVSIPALLFALWVRSSFLPGSSWLQLAEAGVSVAFVYYGIAFFVCIPKAHRALLIRWCVHFIKGWRQASQAQ